jgi:capsular polysaccharide biosynthesis protein
VGKMQNPKSGVEIDIREFFKILRKRIWLIIAITVISALASFYISYYILKPTYEAKISVVIIKAQENTQNQQYDYNDIIMYQDLIKTYAQIAKSRTVAEKALELLELNNIKTKSLLGQILVQPQEGTQIMDLMIRDLEPIMAKDKLNAIATAFIEEATRIFPNGNVQIIDDVITPENPISPNKKSNVIIALFLGLLVSIGLAVFMETFDSTIKSEADIEKHLEITVLGIIPLKA